MEEPKGAVLHTLNLKQRKSVEIHGVKKLDSFDKKEFLIDTSEGFLHIEGKDLSLSGMDMEKGYLGIEGLVDRLTYLDDNNKEKKEGFFKKLFK